MNIAVITIFPELIDQYCATSIMGRAQARGVVSVSTFDPRDQTEDAHRSVDDTPFGGGAGMVMTPGPLLRTVAANDVPRPLFALTPSGRPFTQALATELAQLDGFTLICGRYEGIDQRVLDRCDGEISLGDFVLAGGEIAALAVIEAVTRLIPGGLGNDLSAIEESFSDGLLEHPQYTKPAEYDGVEVPEIVRGGHHAKIERWRRAMALQRTRERRPDLWSAYRVTEDDRRAWREVFGEDLQP